MDNQTKTGRVRLIVSVMMAITGAVFFYEFLSDDLTGLEDTAGAQVPVALAVRYLVAMAVGGAVSGAICVGLFGRHGVLGWVWAALGAVLASLLAGMIGSAIGRLPDLMADGFSLTDVISVGFGLVLIPLSFAGRPYLFVVWIVLACLTHLWARAARRKGGQ